MPELDARHSRKPLRQHRAVLRPDRATAAEIGRQEPEVILVMGAATVAGQQRQTPAPSRPPPR
ncbi:hypothetical protein, partial [Streptomyces caniscabiei]